MGDVVRFEVRKPNTSLRLCAECRHSGKGEFAICAETKEYISIERGPQFDRIQRCGSEGRLWQPKPEPVGFLAKLKWLLS